MRRVSKKRQAEQKEYSKARLSFLATLPLCEVCTKVKMDQRNKSTDIHHKKGRGKFYLDQDSWLAVCRPCHDRIHSNPIWARENNYIIDRS